MQSKVHPTYKTKYRVANWPAYNQALVRRGDVTVWLSSDAIAAWTPGRSDRRAGRTLTYGDVACRFGIPWSQGASAALASALKRIGDDNSDVANRH